MKDAEITLYDNAANRARPSVHSRGLVLRLDKKRLLGKPKAQIVGEFTATPPVLGGTPGNVQTLPDGGVMVGWGDGIPRFTEFDDQGHTTFAARFLTSGAETYRAYRMPCNAAPPGRPDIAIANADGRRQIYASWNGSTTVASWRLLAGDSAGSSATGGCGPADRFASATPLPAGPRYVAAQAMDAGGRILGTSRTIRNELARSAATKGARGSAVRQQATPRLVSVTVPARALASDSDRRGAVWPNGTTSSSKSSIFSSRKRRAIGW